MWGRGGDDALRGWLRSVTAGEVDYDSAYTHANPRGDLEEFQPDSADQGAGEFGATKCYSAQVPDQDICG